MESPLNSLLWVLEYLKKKKVSAFLCGKMIHNKLEILIMTKIT